MSNRRMTMKRLGAMRRRRKRMTSGVADRRLRACASECFAGLEPLEPRLLLSDTLGVNDAPIVSIPVSGTGFAPPVSFSVGDGPARLATGDFNGDSRMDLVSTNSIAGSLSVLFGQAGGGYSAPQHIGIGGTPVGIVAKDLDGDTHLDLAIADSLNDSVVVLYGNGVGGFGDRHDVVVGNDPQAIISEDFDADGLADLAITNAGDGDVTVLYGQGGRLFGGGQDYSVGLHPVDIVAGQFSADGLLDFAAVSNAVDNDLSGWFGASGGGFANQRFFATDRRPTGITSADFNGDGMADLAVTHEPENVISILFGQPSGTPGVGVFGGLQQLTVGAGPTRIVTADFNLDGEADLAVANSLGGTVTVLHGQGDGTFTDQLDIAVGLLDDIVAADLNGDGLMDLALAHHDTDSVSVLLGQFVGEAATDEDTPLALAGISVSDVDVDGEPMQITLSADNGTLTLDPVGVLTFTDGDGDADSTMTFRGTLDDVNATLATLQYQSNLNYNGPDTVTVTANDLGNTGTGGPLTDTKTIDLTVQAVNDAPVNTVPTSEMAFEDVATVISGISVSDVDANEGSGQLEVTLSVDQGVLTVNAGVIGGLTGTDITGSGTGTVVLTGTQAAINATLADSNGLVYLGGQDFNGQDVLTVVTSDQGNAGAGGPLTDTKTIDLTVQAVNDAPVNTVPTDEMAAEDVAKVISGISVSDVDADEGSGLLEVTLGVSNGTLTVSTSVAGGLTATDIVGNGTGNVVLTGTQAAINATLADINGLTYLGNTDFSGTDVLNVTTSDLGNTGSGGPLTDSDQLNIAVLSAAEQAELLQQAVADLRDDGILNNGQENSLIKKLLSLSENRVQAFVNQVNAFISEGILTQEEGDELIAAAETLLLSLA